MSKLDLNRSPYFDDFDASKNYQRILFQPSRPVQARELNQIQSIFHNQIESFANHIFKNGSKVSNARTSIQSKAFVRLIDTPNVEQYAPDTKIVGKTSGITAVIVKAVNSVDGDPATLYVVYTGTGIDGQTSTFIPGEEISIRDENDYEVGVVAVRCPSCPGSGLTDTIPPTGNGQIFTVDEGIMYFEGMFINVNKQDIIITKYMIKDEDGNVTNFEPCKIGLDFVQSIVTYLDDSSLLDPSLGYPNSSAPGADRYKTELVLVKRPYNAEDGENFIPLARIGEGMNVEFMKGDSDYANIMDMMAKRTYETHGDYTIRPFRVSFLNSKKKNRTDPLGWNLSGNEDDLVAVVTPSIAYVKGYRVETISDTPIAFDKARDTNSLTNYVKNFESRAYVLGRPMGVSIWPYPNEEPGTMSHGTVGIFNDEAAAASANGQMIGTLKISDVEYVSGQVGSNEAIYKYYVYDIQMNAGYKFTEARSFVLGDTGFFTNAIVDSVTNKVEVHSANKNTLIYRFDRDHIKSLRSIDDPLSGSISIVVRKKFSGVADAMGNLTFTTSSNEFFDNAGPGLVGWYVKSGVTTKFHAPQAASLTPSSLSLSLGSSAAGASVYIIADILRTNQTEKAKTLTNLTVNTNTAPVMDVGAQIPLGVADAYRLVSVKIFLDGSPNTPVADLTDEYELVSNVTDMAYRESYIRRKAAGSTAINNSHRLAINFDYFEHSGGQGYFTIDSYSSALNAEDSGVTYETLPVYVSDAKDRYPVASSIDFRPIVMGNDPIVVFPPANGKTMIFDIEYYLARADLLQINKDGILYIKKGQPSETPSIPKADNDAMALYEIWLTPYTYTLSDVRTKYIDNRRYTMRDIGSIDKRLQNVEYITALNVLEKSAADMSIKDANGLDRYKNGFVADNFQDFQIADLTSIEFRAAADRSMMQLRPQFVADNKKLKFNASKSSGFVLRGNMAMRPFTEQVAAEQPYATKHLSVNPYLQYNQRGTLVLSPNNDVWTDTNTRPEVVVDVDSGMEQFATLSTAGAILGTDWGSWIDQNNTILTTTTTADVSTTTATTTTTSTRTGIATTVESRTDTYSIDDIVKDVQIVPYVRSRTVEFYATKMKPNTRVYAFFDGQAVSEHCRDIGFQLSSDNASTASMLVPYGSPLITDANGELRGEFRIPSGRFFTGEKEFVLTDDPEMSGDADLESTSAKSVYFAGGIDVTKQSVTMNVVTPTFRQEQVTESRTTVSSTSTTTVSRETPAPVPVEDLPPDVPETQCIGGLRSIVRAIQCECITGRSTLCDDPVAQAFTVASDMFISSLDVFFKQVDLFSDRIFIELRTMVNGYPGTTRLAQKFYTPDQIRPFCSDDSTRAFRVNFDTPVFVEGKTQYCFVVGGASPNTRVWVARLGEPVVDMPGKIVELPATAEVSFRSLNGTTWNAEQFEQIKFKIHRAVFEPGAMKLAFENEHEMDGWELEENPFQTETGKTRIRVWHKNHGFTAGDRVSISVFDNSPFRVRFTDFVPQIEQKIHTSTGAGIITDVVPTELANEYLITVKNMSGVFTAGQTYVCDALVKHVRDNYLITSNDSQKPSSYTLNQCTGLVLENSFDGRFPNGTIGGVPVTEFNNEASSGSLGHSVIEVDSIDTYIINVQTPAGLTGRFGGKGIRAYHANEKFEVFNVSGAYLPYRSSETWTLTGIGHGDVGSVFETDNYRFQPPVTFKPQTDTFLGKPYKVASEVNERIQLGAGQRSINVVADFVTSNGFTSPMVNLDTFSVTTVSNRVEWLDPAKLQSEPVSLEPIWYDETHAFMGNESYKYVTRQINLANPANALNIYLDVYKDLHADFDVYIKRGAPENGSIDNLPWIKVDGISKVNASVDLTDKIEYHINTETDVSDWDDTPFSSFRIKIVGRTKNSAKPPLFSSLRGIAVT